MADQPSDKNKQAGTAGSTPGPASADQGEELDEATMREQCSWREICANIEGICGCHMTYFPARPVGWFG